MYSLFPISFVTHILTHILGTMFYEFQFFLFVMPKTPTKIKIKEDNN